jgi:hypothetical protein
MQNSPHLAELLGKLVPRLASSHDGEVVATARAIGRVLEAEKLDLHDLAVIIETGFRSSSKAIPAPAATPRRSRPKPSAQPPSRTPQTVWSQAASEILFIGLRALTPKENEFLTSLMHMDRRPSPKQLAWLLKLAGRFGVEVERG